MEVLCVREVEELHRFFDDWFNGRLPNEDGAFARFADVLSARFEIAPPDGGVLDRAAILQAVRGGHGARAGQGFRIWVADAEARLLRDGLLAVTYAEWQETGGAARGRRSRALMRQSAAAPNGVEWVRVDETWIE